MIHPFLSTLTANVMLLHLPPEVLNQIFLLLPLKSILKCKRVNRYIGTLISASVEIEYLVQLLLSGHVENPYCKLSVRERLALLEKRSRSKGVDIGLRRKIQLPFRTSGIYDLTGGIYLLGDALRKTLHYMHLPDKDEIPNDQEIEWRGKEIRMEHMIIDMGLNVYENDLLAVITVQPHDAKPTPESNLFDIRLHFYQVSTALLHPEANQQSILVMQMQAEWNRPAVGIEIVGNNLVLILAYGESRHSPDDHIFIYDWKSGVLKMNFRASHETYAGLIFLTQEIILVPNAKKGTFEYWRVPREPSDAPSRPFFTLELPTLYPDDNVGIDTIQCRAEPNPTSGFRYSRKPSHPDPQRAIAIFNLRIRSRESRLIPHFPHPIQIFSVFLLFVHRSSLVKCLDLFKEFISDNEDTEPVPYNDWGVDVCRWLPADDYATRWITTTSGQKCALYDEEDQLGADSPPDYITLLDFNQTEVARLLATQKHPAPNSRINEQHSLWIDQGNEAIQIEDEDDLKDEDWVDEDEEEEVITSEGQKLFDYGQCFLSDVYGRLPYKKFETAPTFKYSGVLIDEERLIGIRNDSREIIYYGQ